MLTHLAKINADEDCFDLSFPPLSSHFEWFFVLDPPLIHITLSSPVVLGALYHDGRRVIMRHDPSGRFGKQPSHRRMDRWMRGCTLFVYFYVACAHSIRFLSSEKKARAGAGLALRSPFGWPAGLALALL